MAWDFRPELGVGCVLYAKIRWQLSNSDESSPFRETNYEPQLFLGFATDYNFAGWTLRDVEMGYNHDSNGRSDPTSRSWNRLYTRLMAENGNWLVEVKPWYVVGNTDDNRTSPNIWVTTSLKSAITSVMRY